MPFTPSLTFPHSHQPISSTHPLITHLLTIFSTISSSSCLVGKGGVRPSFAEEDIQQISQLPGNVLFSTPIPLLPLTPTPAIHYPLPLIAIFISFYLSQAHPIHACPYILLTIFSYLLYYNLKNVVKFDVS